MAVPAPAPDVDAFAASEIHREDDLSAQRRGVVVVGVDGSGRTHRLRGLAGRDAVWLPRFGDATDLAARLTAAVGERRPVAVDDAHLRSPELLLRLAGAAEEGATLLVTRRPTVRLPELAALDGAVATTGAVEVLAPLPDETVATLLGEAWPGPPAADAVARAVAASAGSPVVATALAGWSGDEAALPAALSALVQRRVAVLPPHAAALVPVLAELVPLDPPLLERLTGVTAADLADAVDELAEAGLLGPGRDALVPAVAAAVRAATAPAGRRARGEALAAALADPAGGRLDAAATREAAARLRELGVRGASTAALHLAVARELAPTDPAGARASAQDALALLPPDGADRDEAALVVAEAATVLGTGMDALGPTNPRWAGRWSVVRGVRAAREGRGRRAAEELERGGHLGRVLAAPLRFGTGSAVDPATRTPWDSADTTPADLLYRAAQAAGHPHGALPLVVEAADAVDSAPAPLLPDTPHALGAVLAVLAGDAPTADRLLERALARGPAGAARARHVLLRAWVGLRAGRYDDAVRVTADGVGGGIGGPLPGAREELLLACVTAGLSRRSGDAGVLRAVWTAAEPLLVRRVADLWQLEQLEELAVAAVRLRQEHRTEPVLAVLEEALADLGRPAAWEAAMAWLRLQCAVVREDADAAEEASARLDRAAPAAPLPGRPPDGLHRARAQASAARCWSRALRGEVDADAVVQAGALLVAADLPWEASRLAGQAAIRAVDPAVARRLLEQARDLAAGASPDRSRAVGVVLSEREREVAELVRAGRTHREIGAQLYLSPKTVEHHVARMRSKLGAATRAEFLAALARVMDGVQITGAQIAGAQIAGAQITGVQGAPSG